MRDPENPKTLCIMSTVSLKYVRTASRPSQEFNPQSLCGIGAESITYSNCLPLTSFKLETALDRFQVDQHSKEMQTLRWTRSPIPSPAPRMRVAVSDKAEAEKILQVKRAGGVAEAKYLSGVGMARQRQAIVDGLREIVLAFSFKVPGTSAKDILDAPQYFDTMKDVGASSKNSTVFIPHGPGAVQDIADQIRNGLLQGQAGQQ